MNMINAPHTITTESNQDITIMRRATEILNKDKAREREGEREGGQAKKDLNGLFLNCLRCLSSLLQFGLSRITYEA